MTVTLKVTVIYRETMIVKICGIKTLEIALASVESGADMLGFNFYPPSSRYIDPKDCAEIVTSIRSQVASGKLQAASFTTVGVFVNEPADRIRKIMTFCNLDLAQLAGDESPQDLAALEGKALKAVRPNSLTEADDQLELFSRSQAPALLVDAHVKGAYGGTGETGDWSIAQHLAAQAPILLAGGLNPENVTAAVAAVNPWGVDVASGVESSPGIKDPSKISAFISAARSNAKH
jgi:phosphoribosylanthranilate isomerase